MVTLKDVAKAAGVSTSTASRALDERLPASKSAAAVRVRAAAKELGYVRDPLASALRRSGTSSIGIVVPRLTDAVMAMMYEELAAAAESLVARRVDGIIRTTARTDTAGQPRHHNDVRHVLALRGDNHLPAALGDDQLGGHLATRHLLDLGHTRIGLVGGPAYATSAVGRRQGYLDALADAGLSEDPSLMVEGDFSIDAGENAALQLLSRPDRPTAIFAVNDNIALGVLSMAARLGLQTPDDLSLVGYNDIPVVAKLPVPLTSVRVPFTQIAAGAISLLLDDHEPGGRNLVYAPTLIPRQSTASPPAVRV